jgi:murein DD-endopeptidase MepM/ murein hydrolase activator NlpD
MQAITIPSELQGARVVDFPLRGEWMAVQSPATRIPSHGTDMLAQRYAFDLIRFDPQPGGAYRPAGGVRALLFGIPTREAHGWGEPVHAPLDAEVIAAVDGVPERQRIHPLRELFLATRNAAAFRPTPEHVARLLGNHVLLAADGVHAGFAHFTTGSVAVEVGQRVRAGDLLGRVGHTGNSTAPHLHFQLMDGPDPLTARGLPCAFRAYEVWRDGRWELVERSIPTSTERIRSARG